MLKILQDAILDVGERTGTPRAKTLMAEIERRLTVKGEPAPGAVAELREEFNQQYQMMGQEAKQMLRNITELGILTNDPNPQNDSENEPDDSDGSESSDASASESQRSERHRPKRTKRT